MWISGKKYKALVERVEALERAVNMRPTADGPIVAWPFCLDEIGKPSINEVVGELAKLAGVGYDFGSPPKVVTKK